MKNQLEIRFGLADVTPEWCMMPDDAADAM